MNGQPVPVLTGAGADRALSRGRSVLSPGSETWEEFEAEIGRVGARGTDKGNRDSRVRQFLYPVSAKEASSREEEEVKEMEGEARRRNGSQGGKERVESLWMASLLSGSRMRLGRTFHLA